MSQGCVCSTPQNAKCSSKKKNGRFEGQECITSWKGTIALNERDEELREKLEGVGQLLIDGNNKLKSSVKTSDRAGVSEAEVMIETATGLSWKLNTESSELRQKQESVECQKRKLIEKSLGEIPLLKKKRRLNASLPKQAAKKKRKSNIRNSTTTT